MPRPVRERLERLEDRLAAKKAAKRAAEPRS
jgi:uncharacterized small protein (DUF1192 family)